MIAPVGSNQTIAYAWGTYSAHQHSDIQRTCSSAALRRCTECTRLQRTQDRGATNLAPPQDSVEISEEAKALHEAEKQERASNAEDKNKSSGAEDEKKPNSLGREELATEEEAKVRELKKRDREVRAHEMAHVAAGAGVVRGGPFYKYTQGPDRRQYAVSGHVNIDSAPEKEPEATISKMQQVKRCALAPKDPSASDRATASKAAQTQSKARAELMEDRMKGMRGEEGEDKDSSTTSGTGASYTPQDVPTLEAILNLLA